MQVNESSKPSSTMMIWFTINPSNVQANEQLTHYIEALSTFEKDVIDQIFKFYELL